MIRKLHYEYQSMFNSISFQCVSAVENEKDFSRTTFADLKYFTTKYYIIHAIYPVKRVT